MKAIRVTVCDVPKVDHLGNITKDKWRSIVYSQGWSVSRTAESRDEAIRLVMETAKNYIATGYVEEVDI